MDKKVRQQNLEKFKNLIFTGVSGIYWLANPYKKSRVTWKKDDLWKVYDLNSKEYYWVPSKRQTHRGHKCRSEENLNKYTLSDFVEVESEDTVIDVGAFIGEFSIGANDVGATVHAIEPSPIPFRCLVKNIKNKNSITPYQIGIWNEEKSIQFSIGDDQTENSALNIDAGKLIEKIGVEATTITSFIEENEITDVSFLKVEAEGAEPEVLEGAVNADIKKIVVDAGYERYGKKTVDPVSEILTENGYEVRESNSMVFAKK